MKGINLYLIINNDMKEDISSEIDLIVQNLPNNLTEIEKIRWLYVKLGYVFSYNLDILKDDNAYIIDVDYKLGGDTPICRFQTCHQISYLLVQIFNLLNINSKVVVRDIPRRNYSVDHEAVGVFLETGEKFLLDLTLDLYLIQSGCQTKEFGHSSDSESTYDILSLKEVAKIDSKLNLIPKNGYLNDEIENFKKHISFFEINEENFDIIINDVINKFNFLFKGEQEGKQFINKIWNDIFPSNIINSMKEYNINHRDENDDIQVVAVYLFRTDDFNKCYLYDNNIGLFITEPEKIIEMLDNGWKTNSISLEDDLFEVIDYKKGKKM